MATDFLGRLDNHDIVEICVEPNKEGKASCQLDFVPSLSSCFYLLVCEHKFYSSKFRRLTTGFSLHFSPKNEKYQLSYTLRENNATYFGPKCDSPNDAICQAAVKLCKSRI